MRRSPVQSSRLEASNHTLFWVDFITITSGPRFSVHTALVPSPERSTKSVSDIDTAVVDSLKALDPNRPIREADVALTCRTVRF
jgi:hypothetical protein